AIAVVLLVLAWVLQTRTTFGRSLKAVGAGELAAVASGVNVPEMKNDGILSLGHTSDSTIWAIKQNGGLLSFKKRKFNSYLDRSVLGGKLIQSKAQLFLATNERDKIILFDTQSKQSQSIDTASIYQLLEERKFIFPHSRDKAGHYWLHNPISSKVLCLDKYGHPLALGEAQGVRPDARYTKVFVDRQNRVWCNTLDDLFLWNREKEAFELIPEMSGFSYVGGDIGSSYMEDKQGGLWILCFSGLFYLPPGQSSFHKLPDNHPLLGVNMQAMREDAEGNIWIASYNGLYQLSPSKFINHHYASEEEQQIITAAVEVSPGRYLMSSRSDLGRLFWVEKGQIRPYKYKTAALQKDYRSNTYHLFKDRQDRIWLSGSQYGLRIDGGQETLLKPPARLRYLAEDKNGQIWAALAFSGIYRINEKDEFIPFAVSGINIKNWFLSSIHILENGDILVTSYNQGLARFDQNGKLVHQALEKVTVFNAFLDSDGTIWYSSNNGIYRYKGQKYAHIDYAAGIPEKSVFAFTPDKLGMVWLSCNLGLIRVKKKELEDYLDGKMQSIHWKLFDEGDGMLNHTCTGARHTAYTSEGNILAPTFGGLLEINPQNLNKNRVPPPVMIHRVYWDDTLV
ncbi:MAG: two-component regulator propeller domain-containing protein, partial [Bacteroidota bacterium]